jgi:hypothetical protein
MSTELETRPSRPPVLKKAAAGLVLVGAAALAIWLVIGIIKAVFWTAVVIVAAVGILWAVKTLFW